MVIQRPEICLYDITNRSLLQLEIQLNMNIFMGIQL